MAPHCLKRKGHTSVPATQGRCVKSPSQYLIQHLLSTLEQTFVNSLCLASFLFFPLAPGSPPLETTHPHTNSPMCTALIESRVPLSTETIGNSSSLSLTQCSQSGYMARVLKQGSTLKQLTTWGRLGSYLGIKVCFCCWHPRTRAEALPSLFHTTSRYKPAILPREAY